MKPHRCIDFQNWVHEYLEAGKANPPEPSLKVRLGGCRHCADYFQTMKGLFGALAEPQPIQVSAGFQTKLAKALEREAFQKQRRRSVGFSLGLVAVFVVAILFCIRAAGTLQLPQNIQARLSAIQRVEKNSHTVAPVSHPSGIERYRFSPENDQKYLFTFFAVLFLYTLLVALMGNPFCVRQPANLSGHPKNRRLVSS